MFALFYSLYFAMFTGTWHLYSLSDIYLELANEIKAVGIWTTSIFGDFQITDLNDMLTTGGILELVSYILALITSIGIVVVAVKGIKRVFSVFFMGVR